MEEGAGSKDAAGSKRKVLEVDASLVAATKRPKKPERNMGLDPFQVLASRLHEIRAELKGKLESLSGSVVEIEAKLGIIIEGDRLTGRRTGPFIPGAGAIELLPAAMRGKTFVSGVSKHEFKSFSDVERNPARAATVKSSVTHAYTYGDERRVQVEEGGEGRPKPEKKQRMLEFQIHLPACPYDCRITVSLESPEADVLDSVPEKWLSHRIKRRTSFVSPKLPNGVRSRWQADMTHVTTREAAKGGEDMFDADSFEVEMELGGGQCDEWLRIEESDSATRRTSEIAQDLWTRISAVMPREQTASTLEEVKSAEIELAARRACIRPFDGDDVDERDMERLEFPGTMPVGFSRRSIERCQTETYMVSEKTDGVRYLLAVVQGEGKQVAGKAVAGKAVAVLMDRRFKAWTMPGMEDLGSALGVGTVIDGEVVRNRSWERDVFMCFDLLSVERESVVRVPLQQRLKRLQQDILGQRYLKYLTAHDETVDMRMKTLPLIMKHFYPTKQVGEVLRHIGPEGSDRVYLEKSQEGKPNPSRKRHHKSDGLIFAPNLPYHRGTDFNYMKWKWHDTITLDFEATRSFSAKYGVAVAFDAQDSKVDFTEHIVLSPQEKYRLLGDLGQQNMIITEWEYSPSEGAWVYKMPRPDKKKSNFARTVLSTMMELAEAMDVEEVEYRLSFSNPEEDNWEVANKAKRTEMVAARRRGAKANGGAAH